MRNSMIILAVCLCGIPAAQAGSLWAKKSRAQKELYADDVARKIGDVLTIKITEDTKVDNKTKRDLKKETARSSDFDGDLGIATDNHNLLPRMPGFAMSADASNELKGQADYKDERSFVDTITVVVQDIQPNGNLVVMGRRERDISGDRQIIEVSGIVRPSDIAFDNSIKSEQVANFCLTTQFVGIAAHYNQPGWLGSLFDILWPF